MSSGNTDLMAPLLFPAAFNAGLEDEGSWGNLGEMAGDKIVFGGMNGGVEL